jgi:hypothetical protein
MGEQRAVTIWRRKDTHRDNPVTMEERKSFMGEQETAIIMEVTYRAAVCCHYTGTREKERKSLIREQETATMILFFLLKLKQLSRIDQPKSRRSLINNLITVDWLRLSWLCHRIILITVDRPSSDR